jgi:hypothetical protein
MAAPFAHGANALKWKQSSNNIIRDPGNGGTIVPGWDDGLCYLTLTGAGETRLLQPVASTPGGATSRRGTGVRVTVVADQITGGGTCTINGVTLANEGDAVTFELRTVNGTKVWTSSGGTDFATMAVPIFDWRVHDAPLTPLGLTALSADDLIFTPGTYGTTAPTLKGSDIGGTNATQYARVQIQIPSDYVAGRSASLLITAGMQVVADTSALMSVNCYRTAAPTVDLAGTEDDINSATLAEFTIGLTSTNLVPGDLLDIRIATECTDSGNAAANINSIISQVKLRYVSYR